MLKLYYNPGSCSLASHCALEESGLPFAIEKIDLMVGAHEQPAYREKNIWARVPALDIDGDILIETPAILQYIADSVPAAGLLPPVTTLARAHANEWLSLLSSTVHVAFRPIFRPGRLAATAEGQADVSAFGLQALDGVLGLLEQRLSSSDYALGDRFSFCDLHLFVFIMWTKRPALSGKLTARPGLEALGRKISARPAVRRALSDEGLIFPD
jgi:glutathione S-transferase